MKLYLDIFHGRDTADAELDDWGFQGPLVGPVGIGWTYGQVKLFDEDGDMIHIPQQDDMVHLKDTEGKESFYGDMAFVGTHEDRFDAFLEANKNRLLTLAEFKAKYTILR